MLAEFSKDFKRESVIPKCPKNTEFDQQLSEVAQLNCPTPINPPKPTNPYAKIPHSLIFSIYKHGCYL